MKTIIIDGVEYILTPTKQEKELFIGELNGKRFYLGPGAGERMTWYDAINWCKSLGEGYLLPSRMTLLMCYENDALRDYFITNEYYWTSSQHGPNFAWCQLFFNGFQTLITKNNALHVRAVRVESIQ